MIASPTSALDDLRRISDQVSILNDYTYQVAGTAYPVAYQLAYSRWTQPLQQFGQNSGEADKLRTNLTSQLAQTLYSQFYCVPPDRPTDAGEREDLTRIPPPEARDQAMQLLSAANASRDRVDYHWKVYAVDAQGNPSVMKNGKIRVVFPGEWEFMDPADTSLKVGSVLGLRIQREATAFQPVFYHVRSEALPAQQAEYTRLYFNTTFDGAVVLVREITTTFNRYGVPFMFKCLNHPDLYTRTDSAVLYLDKTHFRFGARLLGALLPALRPHFKDSTPLFTRPLVPGLSFAEDPGYGQSFGMSRCQFVAEGVVRAFHKGYPPGETQLAEILQVFIENGIVLEHMYLNPNSKYPYDFSAFAAA